MSESGLIHRARERQLFSFETARSLLKDLLPIFSPSWFFLYTSRQSGKRTER